MKRYRLLHVTGCVEPALLPGEAKGWREFQKRLVAFLKTGGYEEEDALFYVVTDSKGRLEGVFSFVSTFMQSMWKRAGKTPPWA